MKNLVLANPPLGIYKNEDITIGQAFYMIRLDVNARLRKEILNQSVSFPTYAFNIYGRRGDLLLDPVDYAIKYRERGSLRGKIDLCSKEYLSDDEPEVIKKAREDFLTLWNKRYIIRGNSGEFFLDTKKIRENFQKNIFIDHVKMTERTKLILERFWDDHMDRPHQITKATNFSIKNPLGGQNLGPLFTLANMWDAKYKGADFVIAGSERNLTNYIFLRILCRLAITGEPGMKQIFVYPQLRFREGIEEWNLDSLTTEEYSSDFLRYTLLIPSTNSRGTSNIDKSKLKEARKFVYRIGNLRKVLEYIPGNYNPPKDFIDSILEFNTSKVIPLLNSQFKDLSNRVRKSKLEGKIQTDKAGFEREFSLFLEMAKIITPKICQKVIGKKNA